MKTVIPLTLMLLLGACGADHVNSASAEPIVVPQPVAVAVDAPCVPDTLGPAPVYVDTDEDLWRPENDAADRYQLVLAGRKQRIARLKEIEPVIAGCPRGRSKP